MRAPPPHIDLERLRQLLQELASFHITNWADWPPEAQDLLKMCATYEGFPEDIRALACQCIYMPVNNDSAPIPDEIHKLLRSWDDPKMPDDARARLNNFLSRYQGQVWYYAVMHADEGATDELRALLLTPTVEMTDVGRALLNDFVSRYRIEMNDNLRVLFNEVVSRYRIEGCVDEQWDMKARAQLALSVWKRGKGRPATPIYASSDRDAQIYCALHELRALRKVFGRARVLVERLAELWKINASTLQNALEVRRGSERRKAARRRKAMPRR
jgi:hypothetical protein